MAQEGICTDILVRAEAEQGNICLLSNIRYQMDEKELFESIEQDFADNVISTLEYQETHSYM